MLPHIVEGREDDIVVYLDEVGRGCLCGPVVVTAVIWDGESASAAEASEGGRKLLEFVRDSKKVTSKRRALLEPFLKSHAKEFATASVDAEEIDRINILQATFKAMHAALDALSTPFTHIVVDGTMFKPYMNPNGDFVPHTCVPKGDDTYFGIAAASILAKTHRDRYMTNIHETNPEWQAYAWGSNMGYGTAVHIAAIRQLGATPLHRKTFLRTILPTLS